MAHEPQALLPYKQLLLNIFRDPYQLNIRNNLDRRQQERFAKQRLYTCMYPTLFGMTLSHKHDLKLSIFTLWKIPAAKKISRLNLKN